MKKLGIIGGMGPAATARLFEQIVAFTDVERDQDHIDITILNKPTIPDRTAYLLGTSSEPFVPVIRPLAQSLADADCTVIAIPCNTAHAKIDEISEGLPSVTFVNIPREAVKFAQELSCNRVGILATTGTIETRIYQAYAEEIGLTTLVPDDSLQQSIMDIIYNYVKAGKPVPADHLNHILDQAVDKLECDGFILGCTELSLLDIPRVYRGHYMIDALDVQAWRCVVECGAPAKNFFDSFKQELLK